MSEPATDPAIAYWDSRTEDLICSSCLHERNLSSDSHGVHAIYYRYYLLDIGGECDRCGIDLTAKPIPDECLRFGYIQDGVCKGHDHSKEGPDHG